MHEDLHPHGSAVFPPPGFHVDGIRHQRTLVHTASLDGVCDHAQERGVRAVKQLFFVHTSDTASEPPAFAPAWPSAHAPLS